MEYELVESSGLTIVGTTIRTTNAEAGDTLGRAWHRFFDERLLGRIDRRIDGHTVVGVYTDYDSDESGGYTFMVGAPVKDVREVPGGMEVRTFPGQRFAKIRAHGTMPDVVQATWRQVYASSLPRSFTLDYERYDTRLMGRAADLEVFVGLRSDAVGAPG